MPQKTDQTESSETIVKTKRSQIPLKATQGIAELEGLEVLWRSPGGNDSVYVLKDTANAFIIILYPNKKTLNARNMVDSYRMQTKFAQEAEEKEGKTYTKISFQPQANKIPRLISYGASIREAFSLGRKLFQEKKIDPIITVTNSRNVAENLRIFGTSIVWIKSKTLNQSVYKLIHAYNDIRNNEDIKYEEKLNKTRELLAQNTDVFACYAGDIKDEDLPK